MFTGIIEKKVPLLKLQALSPRLYQLQVPNPWKDVQPGESIAVNGVCLTVVRKRPLTFELGAQTLKKTAFTTLKKGSWLHLERALAANGRFSGHFVLGHVDGVGELVKIVPQKEGAAMWVRLPRSCAPFLIPQGSIALDGVSLTLYAIEEQKKSLKIQCFLLPYTLQKTRFSSLAPRAKIHYELDCLGKWVHRLWTLSKKPSKDSVRAK